MHYLANVPGIEHFLAKKCSCPEGGGVLGKGTIWLMSQGLSTFWLKSAHAWRWGRLVSQNAMQVAYISIMHCSLPALSGSFHIGHRNYSVARWAIEIGIAFLLCNEFGVGFKGSGVASPVSLYISYLQHRRHSVYWFDTSGINSPGHYENAHEHLNKNHCVFKDKEGKSKPDFVLVGKLPKLPNKKMYSILEIELNSNFTFPKSKCCLFWYIYIRIWRFEI